MNKIHLRLLGLLACAWCVASTPAQDDFAIIKKLAEATANAPAKRHVGEATTAFGHDV